MSTALPAPSRGERAALLAILALGLALRVWTIDHGVPHVVGVDEPEILQRALAMMRSGDFNPHFFDYGGLTIYLHTAIASVRFVAGAMGAASGFSSLDNVWVGDFLVWARTATALVGALLVYVVYRAGLRWGVTAALIAAFASAVHPNLVRESHFALTDTPLAFVVSLALLLSLVAASEGTLRWFVAAGLAAGLAAAVKYNGAVAVLMPLAAAAVATSVPRRSVAVLGVLGAAGAGFLIGAPYSMLDLPGFLNAFAYLATAYNKQRPASEIADLYVTYLRNSFGLGRPWSHMLGWPALLLSLTGFGLMAAQIRSPARRAGALAVLLFSAAYFWMISHQSLVYARYSLPLIPMVSLAIGVAAARILEVRFASTSVRRLVRAALAVAALAPMTHSVFFNWDRRLTSTEALAARWLERHVPRGELILSEAPTFRLPPGFHLEYQPWLTSHSIEAYREQGAKYLVASSERSASAAPSDRYRRLLASTQVVHVIPRTDTNPGPTLTVLKVGH